MLRLPTKLALASSLMLIAGAALAQTEFPLSLSGASYHTPALGVAMTEPMQEGRSVYVAPRRGEISGTFDDLSIPFDDELVEPAK